MARQYGVAVRGGRSEEGRVVRVSLTGTRGCQRKVEHLVMEQKTVAF